MILSKKKHSSKRDGPGNSSDHLAFLVLCEVFKNFWSAKNPLVKEDFEFVELGGYFEFSSESSCKTSQDCLFQIRLLHRHGRSRDVLFSLIRSAKSQGCQESKSLSRAPESERTSLRNNWP
jgi:hypothetical protein